MEVFSERIKALRKEVNITQEELGRQLGVSRYAVLLYEKGTNCPDMKGLVTLADYFGVSIDYLAGRTDKREVNR